MINNDSDFPGMTIYFGSFDFVINDGGTMIWALEAPVR
jgi:hypothetical protein